MRAVSYRASQRTFLARARSLVVVPTPKKLAAESCLALRNREAALVQRAADDHALEALERGSSQLAQIVERADAARVDQRHPGIGGRMRNRLQLLHPRPGE